MASVLKIRRHILYPHLILPMFLLFENVVCSLCCYEQALHTADFALLLVNNQSLKTASKSQLFGSVVRALVLYRGGSGLIPSQDAGIFSALLYIVTAIIL